MSDILITGPSRIEGSVAVRGAKNAALPIVLASMVSSKPVTLENVPTELKDILAAVQALSHVGSDVNVGQGSIEVSTENISTTTIPPEISGKFRSSLLFLGLLAGRCGHAKITMPGGCDLGDRKFDLHLEGLRKLGAEVKLSDDSIEVFAEKLIGADINFYLPTTTGTENIMIAACFAKGTTRIFNANTRPEIVDFGNFLNMMGAKISVRNRVVCVEGPVDFSSAKWRIMPGWDEALFYMIAAGMTRGSVCIENFSLEHLKYDAFYLREAGIDISERNGNVYVSSKAEKLKPFDLFTAPYPGVNSDMQPLFAALASQCTGESTITDQRFTERFAYVGELKKLGAQIDNYGNCAVIKGPCALKGANVKALDLRCGASLLLSAMVAEGPTKIENCYQIYRGHEHIVSRLRCLGADIKQIK
jgi:UDP-N-acetylglucosamine 1-carboxyvinyltransferase